MNQFVRRFAAAFSGCAMAGAAVLATASGAYGLRMYWTDRGGQVQRANVDGSSPEVVVSGLGELLDIELDEDGEMYFADYSSGKIYRAAVD